MKTKLQNFFIDEEIKQKPQNQSKSELLLLEDRRSYVYIYLDPRKPGKFKYGNLDYIFDYEPFYVGKGINLRKYDHLKEADNLYGKPDEINKSYNRVKIRKIHKIYDICGEFPIILILKENLSDKEALDLEIFCIKEIGRMDLKTGPLTNLTDGGQGSLNIIYSPERNQKISEYGKGRIFTPETRAKISKALTGKHPSEETRLKIGLSGKGRKHSEETKRIIGEKSSINGKGRVFTPETRDKMREAKQGKTWEEIMGSADAAKSRRENTTRGWHHSEETKLKIGDKNRNRKYTEEQKRQMRENPNNGQFKSNYIYTAISPDGIIYQNITRLVDFCTEHKIDNVGRLYNYIVKNKLYNGWLITRKLKNSSEEH